MNGPVWLVLPTYNEAKNIRRIVPAVLDVLEAAAAGRHRVLIVDDNSPDGTGRIADGLAAEHANVEVLHRTGKEGLGRAYVAGFGRALEEGAGLLLQMDSDLSHEPRYLPALLAAVERGADVAIGSRYVAGGGVKDWGPARRAISRGGCWYARMVLGVPISDLTGGFKCFRREVLQHIDMSTVDSHGYSFQIETTYRALRAGFRVEEVPIVFGDRSAGDSKMSGRIAVEAFLRVPGLRLRTSPVVSAGAEPQREEMPV